MKKYRCVCVIIHNKHQPAPTRDSAHPAAQTQTAPSQLKHRRHPLSTGEPRKHDHDRRRLPSHVLLLEDIKQASLADVFLGMRGNHHLSRNHRLCRRDHSRHWGWHIRHTGILVAEYLPILEMDQET